VGPHRSVGRWGRPRSVGERKLPGWMAHTLIGSCGFSGSLAHGGRRCVGSWAVRASSSCTGRALGPTTARPMARPVRKIASAAPTTAWERAGDRRPTAAASANQPRSVRRRRCSGRRGRVAPVSSWAARRSVPAASAAGAASVSAAGSPVPRDNRAPTTPSAVVASVAPTAAAPASRPAPAAPTTPSAAAAPVTAPRSSAGSAPAPKASAPRTPTRGDARAGTSRDGTAIWTAPWGGAAALGPRGTHPAG
jgi:hypothetical protein